MNGKLELVISGRTATLRARHWIREYRNRVPENVLTPAQKGEIYNTFGKYYKKMPFSYTRFTTVFHNLYTKWTGNYDKFYLPADLHYCFIDPFYNNHHAARFLDNKCLYSRIFPAVRQPDTLACRMNGIWIDENQSTLDSEDLFRIIKEQEEVVIKKATNSEGGHGVFFAGGKDIGSLAENSIKEIDADIIIQKPLKQHKVIGDLNSSSINTIRVMTLLTNAGVKIISAVIRMGIDGSRKDNSCSGGISCGIKEDGTLRKKAYSFSGDVFEAHPTSGIVFDGYQLIGLERIYDCAKSLHPQIPMFRLVSWDFCVEEDGEPCLVEANLCYGGIELHQLNNGPLFGENTPEVLCEVFGE